MAVSYKLNPLDRGAHTPQSWAFIGDRVLISLTQAGSISEARWKQFLDDFRASGVTHVLGTSVGSVDVNSVQRKSVSELLKGKRIAVVTDHRIARGIVTALGWLGLDIKSFDWPSLSTAVDYLGVPGLATKDIVEVVAKLLKESGAPPPQDL